MTAVGKDAVLISYDFFNETLGHHQAIFTVQVNISKLVMQPTLKTDDMESPGSHLRYLGFWNFDNPSQFPVRFTNVVLQREWQFSEAEPLDADALRQAVTESRAGQQVLARIPEVFFGHGMVLLPNWESRWAQFRKALTPFIMNGSFAGVQMGDELLGQGLPLSNLTAATNLIRASWPKAIIYVNEALSALVWNRVEQGTGLPISADINWKLPPEIDLVSVDFYCEWWGGGDLPGRGYVPGLCASHTYQQTDPRFDQACHVNESLNLNEGCEANCSAPATCASWLQTYYTQSIIPRFGSKRTRAIVVPGATGTNVWLPDNASYINCSDPWPGVSWGGSCGSGQCGAGSGSGQELSGCKGAPNKCLNPLNWSVQHEIEFGCPRPGCSGTYGFDWMWSELAVKLFAWAQTEPLVAGFFPFHWASPPLSCDCGGCFNPPEDLGVISLPKTLSAWQSIGRAVLQRAAGLKTDDTACGTAKG
jgi:hypothetical protein|eukprot:COSAG01_NODE_6861_length_3466_cov_2.895456_1_plen_477_part_00